MKKSKIIAITIISIFSLFALTGCFNPNLVLEIEPDPVEFTRNNLSQEVKLKITTEGIGNITLDEYAVIITDQNGNDIYNKLYKLNLGDPFIVGGISETKTFTLDLEEIYKTEYSDFNSGSTFEDFYDQELKGKNLKLKIAISGSINPTLETNIYLN